MKKYLFKYIIVIFLSPVFSFACNSLPKIEPDNSAEVKLNAPYLKEAYQLTHSIKADLPNGNYAVLIGLTEIEPSLKSINAVIMTVDGGLFFLKRVMRIIRYQLNEVYRNLTDPDSPQV
jgi:hypothetical protein